MLPLSFDASPQHCRRESIRREDEDMGVASPTCTAEQQAVVDLSTAQLRLEANSRYQFRLKLYDVVTHPHFDNFILVCILASSIVFAFEDPVDHDAEINSKLKVFEAVFVVIFTAEFVGKLISFSAKGYFADGWNDLDALCVVSSLFGFMFENIGPLRVLRVFRVLRPLRAIKKARGLHNLVVCLLSSMKAILNVLVMTILLIYMFAVIGVGAFKGKFGYCTDRTRDTAAECIGVYLRTADNNFTEPPVPVGREWMNPWFNFDNVGRGMLTLLASATTEGWVSVMYSATDGTDEGHGPTVNGTPAAPLFFLVFMVLVACYMMSVFVGYVIVVFSQIDEQQYVLFYHFCLGAVFGSRCDKAGTCAPGAVLTRLPSHLLSGSLFNLCCTRLAISSLLFSNVPSQVPAIAGTSREVCHYTDDVTQH
jgi:hypothetical protein